MATAFVSHPACAAHLLDQNHPESFQRLNVIRDELVSGGLFDFLLEVEAPRATREELGLVHSAAYIEEIFSIAPESGIVRLDEDTMMDSETLEAVLRAAGAAAHASRLVLSGEAGNAFCCVRPPGHHATRDSAMGFCFFNNVAVGAAQALEVFDLKRIAIIDFDIHYGNGTRDIFRHDDRVLFLSIFQQDYFSEAGAEGDAAWREEAIAVDFGIGGNQFRETIDQRWRPAMDEFQPEMIFVSAGFDAHSADSFGDSSLVDNDYRWISEWIVDAAERHSEGRLLSVLEGGYELVSLGRCAARHVRALMGI
ncbi:MAG: histone deacetylase family protein [Verrucomicrobiales bacterium]|nr:histone deacetylase family protein [Verrucomicrobiales bacterium]